LAQQLCGFCALDTSFWLKNSDVLHWLCALRAGVGIGKGFIVAAVLSGIGTVLLGVLVYHERISGPALIGVVLGIVAIAFLAAG